jgi:hypothetical protein
LLGARQSECQKLSIFLLILFLSLPATHYSIEELLVGSKLRRTKWSVKDPRHNIRQSGYACCGLATRIKCPKVNGFRATNY